MDRELPPFRGVGGQKLGARGISLSQGFGLRPTKPAVTAWCREKDKRQKFKDKSKFTDG